MSIARGTQIGLFAAALGVAVLVGRWTVSPAPAAVEAPDADEESEEAEDEAGDVVTLDDDTRDRIGLKVEPAQERPFATLIRATGIVAPNETRVAHVRLLSSGRVETVHVRAGDQVKSGQPLVSYDNVEVGQLLGEYAGAVAGVNRAAAEADVARRAVERATKLVESGGLPRAEYERREAELKRAQAEAASAAGMMTNVERKLQRFGVTTEELTQLRDGPSPAASRSRTVVRAPFSGVVTAANVAPGDAVDTERELFTIADLSTVWIIGDVYQKDIASVRPGQSAQIATEAYPGERFTGRISNVSDVLDPNTRTAKVRAEVPNPGRRLKLQMFVSMEIPSAEQRPTLVVPAIAVQQIDDDTVVFVQTGDDTFQKRPVRPGGEVGGMIAVLEGLKAGERIVTQGAFMLKSKLKAGSIEAEGEEEEEEEKEEEKPKAKKAEQGK